MADLAKLVELLNDPQTRELVRGLAGAHGNANEPPDVASTVDQVNAVTSGDEVESWLSDRPNQQVTPQDIRAALGDDAIDELARYNRVEPDQAAHQLAMVLPELIDASSDNGKLIDEEQLRQALATGLSGEQAPPA
jgi:uncharacterized protein YidB (DUF937 family)